MDSRDCVPAVHPDESPVYVDGKLKSVVRAAWPDHSNNSVHQQLSLISLFEIGEYVIAVSTSHRVQKDMGFLLEDGHCLSLGLASVDGIMHEI